MTTLLHRLVLPLALILALFIFITPSIYSSSTFKTVDWRDLSDRTLTETGEQALKVYGEAWQHAETEHFVYHFHDAKEAETVYVHAEAYYGWVKQMFGVQGDDNPRKSHIFIFEDREVWRSFNVRSAERLPGAEAFTNGFELFIYREPFFLEPQRVLAHEITHLVLYRFVSGRVPLFLNEGFAEFMATKAIAMKADGDDFRVKTFQMIPEEEYIDLKDLGAFTDYPAAIAAQFYNQSELLVRFLLLNYRSEFFYMLLKLTAQGRPFHEALEEIYEMDLETLSTKFRNYALTR